jgi:AcrR family transcriptional regulator
MTSEAKSSRLYKGVTTEDRRIERRLRLIAAALEVYGSIGFKRGSVRAVCQAAGLTERYFYEAFDTADDLLIASLETVNVAAVERLRLAAQSSSDPIHSMVSAFFSTIERAPLRSRIFLTEVRGASEPVDRALSAWQDRFGVVISEELRLIDPPRFLLRGIVGGLSQIALAWLEEGAATPIEEVVAEAERLFDGLLRRSND